MKYLLSIWAFLFSATVLASATQPLVVPVLVGGLNIPVVMLCYVKTTRACSSQHSPYHYFACLHHHMKLHFICRQNIAFFRETSGIIKKVKRSKNVDIVLADIMAAGHSSEYFMVDRRGEIISPVLNVDIRKGENYSLIKQRYPHVSLWPIVEGSPQIVKEKDGSQQIIFQQVLLNGCYRCQRAGTAKIAYRFSANGDFQGRYLLRLVMQD